MRLRIHNETTGTMAKILGCGAGKNHKEYPHETHHRELGRRHDASKAAVLV